MPKNKFIIPHNRPTLGPEEEKAAVRVLRLKWLAQGKEVLAFENEFCGFQGLKTGHAVAVSSGTAALFLALWALRARGKEVAFPVYSCAALRNATAAAGAKEVLLDTEKGSPNLDLKQLKKSKAGIAIVPHMFGLPVDLSEVEDIEIIEDCAQSLGAAINKVKVGLHGMIGIFSFYATKLMTSGGMGGMVVSKDKQLIDSIRDYREFDQRHDKKKRFNFKMTDLQAAVGREQLKKLPGFLKRRAEIFQRYQESGLELIDTPGKHLSPVRYRAVIKAKDPAKGIKVLEKAGIKAIIPIEGWELLESRPNALKLTKETISLPLYPGLTDKEVGSIISEARKP